MTQDHNNTFCVLPWIHLYVGTDGNVLPCCQGDRSMPLGNINDTSISAILNSEKIIKIRQQMILGEKSSECARCYQLESNGLQSERQIQNRQWEHLVDEIMSSPDTVNPPIYLDIRLNNVCNLKCRMCSSYYSSSIQQEEYEIWGKESTAFKKSQRDYAMTEVIEFMPGVDRIYFAGGEPLLSSEHYQILQSLIDIDRTNVTLVYNTNFTSLNFKNLNVLDFWQQFKNVTVLASLDAEHKVAEYVRHGTNWEVIEQNINSLLAKCPHVTLKIASAVGFMNVTSLISLQQRWHNQGLVDINQFYLSVMISPEHLTLQVLPDFHKERIEKEIQNHIEWCKQHGATNLIHEWRNAARFMKSSTGTQHLVEFNRLTAILDQHRGESFATVFPEFEDLIDV